MIDDPRYPLSLIVLALTLTACGSGAPDTSASGGPMTDGTVTGRTTPDGEAVTEQTLTVLAAASLTDVFERLAADVEADHPGVTVDMSFAGSSTIVQQVNEGAPADVVALAGQESLEPLEDDLRVTEPVVFTTNALELVVPADNPAGISGLEGLTTDGIRLVVCEVEVPCGAATDELLAQAGIDAPVASYEHDVRATLTKVQLGEADAGIVYRTDVAAAGAGVTGIAIPAADNVVSSYPILAVSDSTLAQTFIDEVLSERGQEHLADAGFGAP